MSDVFAGLSVTRVTDKVVPDYGRWLIYGQQGSGKSTLASTIARLGKTLYIDLIGERGTRAFVGEEYAGNIYLTRPKSISEFDTVFKSLHKGDHDYQAVVIDSVTSLQRMALQFAMGLSEQEMRDVDGAEGDKVANLRTWGRSLAIMSDMFVFWYSLADGERKRPMHVVMTAQVKMVEDEVSGLTDRLPDIQKGAITPALASPDYVLYTKLQESEELNGKPRHVALFGPHIGYRTKARVPVALRDKIPTVIGLGKNSPDLHALSKVLQVGGLGETPVSPSK